MGKTNSQSNLAVTSEFISDDQAVDLDLKLELEVEESYNELDNIAEFSSDADSYEHLSSIDLPLYSGMEQLRVLVAHEDRQTAQTVKKILSYAGVTLQFHRVTSLDDLKGSLLAQDWDVIGCLDNSNEFETSAVAECAREFGKGAAALFLHQAPADGEKILSQGFADFISLNEPLRIINGFFNASASANHNRQAKNSQQLVDEVVEKNTLLLDSSTDAIAYVADGMIMHGNQALLELLDYDDIEDIAWQSFIDFVIEEDQHVVKGLLRRFAKGEGSDDLQSASIVRENGESTKVEFALAIASHEGEQCIQVLLRKQGQDLTLQPPEATELKIVDTHSEANSTTQNIATVEPASDNETAEVVSLQQAEKTKLNFDDVCSTLSLLGENNAKDFVLVLNVDAKLLTEECGEIKSFFRAVDSLEKYLENSASNFLLPAVKVSSFDWILVAAENQAEQLQNFSETLMQEIASATKSDKLSAISIGAAQYGVADIDPVAALSKAFSVCIERQNSGGGFKQYVPRISDNDSSSALLSALELDRLSIRYQPVIGLQNQPIHLYEAQIFITEDDGRQHSAREAMQSLGVEIENTQIDEWFFEKVVAALQEEQQSDSQICIAAPITASAIVNKNFFPDLMSTFEKTGLSKSCISFSTEADVAQDYLEKTAKLYSLLRQAGFRTTICGINEQNTRLLNEIKPSFAVLSDGINTEQEQPWQQTVKTVFDAAKTSKTECIVSNISSAADLAQIWQCGAPFIKGSYLQDPLPTLSYEFSDIG